MKKCNLSKRDINMIINGVVIGSIVTIIGTLAAITISQNRHMFSLKDISKLNMFTDIIEATYYTDIDEDEIKSSIYNGIFESLDEYSCYISKEDYQALLEETSKQYYGIGVHYAFDSYADEYRILSITENSPAYNAGLKVNDIIKEVDGVKISKMKLDDVVDVFNGDKGSIVNLKILREDEELDFTITRDDIKVTYCHSYQLTDEIGYILIDSFSGDAADDFKECLNSIRSSDSIILDLRNNPGGDVDVMLNILKQITPNGLVATLKYKDESTEDYKVVDGVDLQYNFVILVNSSSASCSEIMTAYMQENNYATVVGEQTYGKGVVQGLHELSDGAAIKLTIASYVTPNGNDLGSVGLTPDIEVDDNFKQVSTIDDVLSDVTVLRAIESFK